MGVPPVASLMVPPWYMEAFLRGVPKERREALVREECLKREPDAPDEVVALMFEMYEMAMTAGQDSNG